MPETASAPSQAVAAPRPLSPIDGERVEATSIPFTWSAVPGAEDYVLQVAADADFKQSLLSLNTGPTTGVTLYHSLPAEAEQKVFWRVRAADQKGWSPAAHFLALDEEALRGHRSGQPHESEPVPVHPAWEANRQEALSKMHMEESGVDNPTVVALVLGALVLSFVVFLLILFVMGQVTYQGEVFP